MGIATAIQKGSFIYIYDEKGKQLGIVAVGSGKFVGYSATFVCVQKGSFVYTYNEKPTSYFPLPKSLLKKIGANPQTSSIINTAGRSMYPTIIGGADQILVDLSKKEIYDGKIYLIRLENTIMAKRIQKLPNNKLRIISDNKEYESYNIDLKQIGSNFSIIGQVLWICRILD